MTKPVVIITEHKAEPNLRKLARALIALAEQQLAKQPGVTDLAPSQAVIPDTGDAT